MDLKKLLAGLAIIVATYTGCDLGSLVGNKVNKVGAEGDAVAAIAFSLLEAPTNVGPRPDNASEICEFCNGKGKVGDGVISVTCLACDGTGKKKVTGDIGAAPEPVVESPKVCAEGCKCACAETGVCNCKNCPDGCPCEDCPKPVTKPQPVATARYSAPEFNGLGEWVRFDHQLGYWVLAPNPPVVQFYDWRQPRRVQSCPTGGCR